MRKEFNFNLVPKLKLPRKNVDGKRFYVHEDGTLFRSVTTVISEKSDKTALNEWKKRVGEETAKKISARATVRGTSIHSMAEKYLLNEDYVTGAMPVNLESFKPIKSVLDNYVDDIYGIELPLYSRTLRAAGTTDLVAKYNNVNSIIDFKTSKKLKKEDWILDYFIQSTIYSMMFQSLYKIEIPQIVIVITVDHEKDAQVFVKQRASYVDKVLEYFS